MKMIFFDKKGLLSLFLVLSSLFVISCSENKDGNENEQATDDLKDSSAFITKLVEYHYAPGQHAFTAYSATPENFVGKPSYLCTNPTTQKTVVSLGGWGGYIVGKFNHNVLNAIGNDFIVLCGSSPSPEPAVVYVMSDENGNGLPDETWYELKGSEFSSTQTVRAYQVTYYKPAVIPGYVTWKDNKGNADTLKAGYGTSTTTNLWWKDTNLDSVVFTGTRLPKAYYNENATGTQSWVIYPSLFTWGYAENAAGTDFNSTYKGNEFNISNAVDDNGNQVTLSSIRFVKVQTGVFH
jgi:hypothetical protein